MQDKGNEIISLAEAARRALQMADDAHAQHEKRVAAAEAACARDLAKITGDDLADVLARMDRKSAEGAEQVEALKELNASLEAANAYLRKIRSRPEHAPRLSSLMIVDKGYDDGEIDDAQRSNFIKVIKPTFGGVTDPLAALNDGVILDRIYNNRKD